MSYTRQMPAKRGGLPREAIEPLVEMGYSTRRIGAELQRSQATIKHWLRVYGLKTNSALSRPDPRTVCEKHGSPIVVTPSGFRRCRVCNTERQARKVRERKRELVAAAGGACALCGYDRYLGALHFHHVDPAAKTFGIGRGRSSNWQRVIEEAAKCVLLCANCHAEVEGGVRAC